MGANGPTYTDLDHKQTITQSFVEAQDAHRVINVAGSLVPTAYDEIDLTYVASGNGVGQIQTATYKAGGATVATLTMTYDVANNLIQVKKT